MALERYFPILDPPSGGLQGLQIRLDRGPRARRFRPAAAAVLGLVAVVSVMAIADLAWEQYRKSVQVETLRETLAEHRAPAVMINGQQPAAMDLESERLEAYFLDEEG